MFYTLLYPCILILIYIFFFLGMVTLQSEPTTLGMMDRSRMVLCMFMFTILIVNPFSSTFSLSSDSGNGDYLRHHDTGRTLQGVVGHGEINNIGNNIIV